MVIDFIDTFKDPFGIEPICRVLTEHGCGIAPFTYHASKARLRSARAARDVAVLVHVVRIHTTPTISRRLYGARKVWRELACEQAQGEHRELAPMPRCQVERLMAAYGLVGVPRGRPFVTTRLDTAVGSGLRIS